MIDASIFIGEPLIFKKNLHIYPPKVKDVVANSNFNFYYKILTLTDYEVKKEIGDRLAGGEELPSVFEYLMLNC